MAPTLVTTPYYVQLSPQGTSTLTTTSFTPSNGEVLVIKLVTWDSGSPLGAPTGGSQTYTSRVVNAPGGFNQWCAIYTAIISGSPGSMTVSSTPSVSLRGSMVVERWSGATLAATPITATSAAFGAATGSIIPSAATSIISWCAGDAQSVDPSTRAYLASATEDGIRDDHVGANGVDYHANQSSTGTSSQSYGLSAPTGMQYVTAAIEVQDSGGAPANPDPVWAPHLLIPPGRISPAGFWVPWSGDPSVTGIATQVAPATEATGTGSALDAAVAVGANATEAIGTGSALDATVAGTANAAEATGTGVANDAVASVVALPTSADGTGTANDATVTTSGSTNASAAEATGSGSAADAVVALGVNAAEATGTGFAPDASVASTTAATEATGTGTAPDATAAIGANAAAATATGSALDATVSTSSQTNAPAAEASGSGVANDAIAALGVPAGVAIGTGVANDATVSTAAQTDAPAGVASGTGAANDAVISITTFAGVAAATAAAYDATVILGAPGAANAGVASGIGTAYDARVRKMIPRPFSGVTSRPNTGTTTRPSAGITQRP